MNSKSLLRWLIGVVVCLTLSDSAARAQDAATDTSLEIIQFKAPPGWKASDQGGSSARFYTSPDSTAATQTMIVVVLGPQQDKLDLGAGLKAFQREMTQNGKVTQSSDVSPSKTRQGFDAVSQTFTNEVAGQKVLVRIVAANVNNRMATFSFLASTPQLNEKHMPEMDALLRSVRFNTAAAPAGNANAELAALEKERQALIVRLMAIDARMQQLKGASAPAGAPMVGVPIRQEDAALAKAIQQFAHDADRRRKVRTVLGDILTLDAKPIPNIAVCTVFVGGTTLAGERSTYTLDVDQNGHFEQKLPDGVYRVIPTVAVTVNGHRVPVDVVPIDGSRAGSSHSSAEGIVQDFRLVINTVRPGGDPSKPDSYFGGSVEVRDPTFSDLARHHPGTKVRVSFVPTSAAVDGSRVEPFIVDLDINRVTQGEKIWRLPLAAYRVSASLVNPNGSTTALGCAPKFDVNAANAMDLFWEGDGGSVDLRNTPIIFLRD